MKKKQIVFLFGGCSSEHEVSLQSAQAVLTHVDETCYLPLPVGITREGQWFYYTGAVEQIGDGSWCADRAHCVPCAILADREGPALHMVRGGRVERVALDGAFPILHGKNGEDGTVQGLLALAGVPLIGCGTLSSALCMDKDRAHKLAEHAGLRVPRSVCLNGADAGETLKAAASRIGYPLFVKPVRSGSSFGISRVEQEADLPRAAALAFAEDDHILLEEEIRGFEVGCAVMGCDTLTTGAVDEIALSGGFFDFEEKYTLKTSRIHCPARIPAETALRVRKAAETVYRALDCRVFARVDFFLTPEGEIVFNEVNTIPGFTSHSRYPGMMAAAGIPFQALVNRLIALGVGE